jgi:acyl carrier protein
LDSFATLDLTSFLSQSFGVELDPADVNAETFRSVNSLAALIASKREK